MAVPPRKRRSVPFRHSGLAETRRQDLTRIDKMTVKVTRVTGYVLLTHEADVASAEASVDVPFPVMFTERPVFTFGGELAENNSPFAGSYPTISAVVVGWEAVGVQLGVTDGRFVGASIAVVTSGLGGMQMWLHYSFEGKAIRNPVTYETDGVEGEI